MSYRETKRHRNNLAKLAILNSEPYEISLPTYFSSTQFTSAAMDDFDQCEFYLLAGITVAHDTTRKLFQIKPASNIRKPLESKVNLKRISCISVRCHDINFSTNKVINYIGT